MSVVWMPEQKTLDKFSRAASVFHSDRYKLGALHLGLMAEAVFNITDVHEVIKTANQGRASPYPLIEGRMGDPTQYTQLKCYEGFHRHFQRYVRFRPPQDYEGYLPMGDESLRGRFKEGHRHKGEAPWVPPAHVQAYITPGVAGALRLISEAMILPPRPNVIPSAIEETIRRGAVPDLDQEDSRTFATRHRGCSDNVVVPLWTYVTHLAESFRTHGDVKICNLREDGQVDIGHLKSVIDESTRTVLFATVGNPLSVAMEPKVFDEILRIVEAKMKEYNHPILVIADVIYEHFRKDQSKRIDPIYRADQSGTSVPVIKTSSMSKMMPIPGQRLGYFVVDWDPSVFPAERHDFFTALNLLYWPTLGPVSTSSQRALASLYTAVNSRNLVEDDLAPVVAVMVALKDLQDKKGEGDKHILFSSERILAQMREMNIPEDHFSSSKISSRTRKLANKVLAGYGVDITSQRVKIICDRLAEIGYIDISETEGSSSFYKLIKPIPSIEHDKEGQLKLYGISENREWAAIGVEYGIETEDARYQAHKDRMREIVAERVFYFASKLDEMKRSGQGVYLHPAYYDKGELSPDRFNAFYVLWGFDKLRVYSPRISQAAIVATKCVNMGLPIIAGVPAEKFVPFDARTDETSYIRTVALMDKREQDEMFKIIAALARELG